MKKVLLFSSLLLNCASAQVYTPPAQPAQPAQPAANTNDTYTRPQQKPAASPIGNEIPFLDPSAETVAVNGQKFAITDNRLFAARFQKYLNEPEDNSDEAKAYRLVIKNILGELSPLNQKTRREKLLAAVRLLPSASAYPSDAGLCDSLMNAIYTAMLSQQNIADTKELMGALDSDRNRIINNMTVLEKKVGVGSTPPTPTGGGRGTQQPQKPNTAEYINYNKRVLEIEVLKKKYETQTALDLIQAKIQYQALLVQFFMQRRFEHAIMGARFYNLVFSDGDTKLRLQKGSDAEKLFGESVGMPPTVSSIDSMSSEGIRDSENAIKAFNNLLDQGDLDTATKRLSEAFLLGEYLEPVRTLPRERKQKCQQYAREGYALIAALDTKDYTVAREKVQKLKAMAKDFDATKAEAAIATFTRVSDMHLVNARNALMSRDNAKAQEEITKAMEVWPQNPGLANIDKALIETSAVTEAKRDFERLLADENYRAIFKDQYRLAPVIQGDARLEDAFKQIITNITQIDTALAQAKNFSRLGQDYAAWEMLKTLRDDAKYSRDPELGKELELLSGRVGQLTNALERGRSLEEQNEVGSALAWYLKARGVFPNSTYAQKGIDRLIERIQKENSASLPPPAQAEDKR